jgi:hypothetical protein
MSDDVFAQRLLDFNMAALSDADKVKASAIAALVGAILGGAVAFVMVKVAK